MSIFEIKELIEAIKSLEKRVKDLEDKRLDRVDRAPGFDQVRSTGRNGSCIVCGAELTEGYGPACPECEER